MMIGCIRVIERTIVIALPFSNFNVAVGREP